MKEKSPVTIAMLAYVAAHPGCTVAEVAAHINESRAAASSRLCVAFKREWVDRELDTSVKPPRYLYYGKGHKRPLLSEPAVLTPAKAPAPDLIATAVGKMVDHLAAGILKEVETRLEAALTRHLERALPSLTERMFKSAPALPPVQAVRTVTPDKKKVVVVGLLPQQAGMIQQEFGNEFDLRFVSANETSRLKSVVSHSDATLVMVGFISHDTEYMIRSVGVKPILVHGGMTRLRDVLTELYLEEPHD